MRRLAVELLAEIRRLDRRITEATTTLGAAVTDSSTTLTELHGIGDDMAAKSSPAAMPSAGSDPHQHSPRSAASRRYKSLPLTSSDVTLRAGDRHLIAPNSAESRGETALPLVMRPSHITMRGKTVIARAASGTRGAVNACRPSDAPSR